MPTPVIVKKTKLKSQPGSLTRDGFEVTWRYLVEVDQVVEQSQVLALLAEDADIPKPVIHSINVAGTISICDRITAEPSRQSRRHWIANIDFKPPRYDDDSPQPPPPIAATPGEVPARIDTDYADWSPSLSRSPNRQTQAATKAFYLGGYNGIADVDLVDWSVGGTLPVEIVNSAFQNILEGPEAGVSTAIWTARFYADNPNENIFDYEGTTNSSDVEINYRGLTVTWPKWTVRLEGVSVQTVVRGGQERWEMTLTILEDPRTFEKQIADRGTVRRAFDGDPDNYGGSTVWSAGKPPQRPILDSDDRLITAPVYLNGNGQPLQPRYAIVYGKWRAEPEIDWNTMPYLFVIVVPPTP